MNTSKTEMPATAWGSEPAPNNLEQLGGQLENNLTPGIITAQLVGSDRAIANGIRARNALDLCRRLVAAGADPDTELICYRGDTVALRISSIGYGARFTVEETATRGPRFVRWKAFRGSDVSAYRAPEAEPALRELAL